jgi:drug/metabolite transporter (DMT)-like permease
LGLVGVVIFGLTLPMTRLAVADFDPLLVTLLRAIIAAVPAALALWLTGAPRPLRQDWPRLAAYAACVVLAFPLLMTIAMRLVPSAHGGIVLGLMPLVTAMAGVVIAGERPSALFWACGVAGTLAVTSYAVLASGAGMSAHGADILLAAAAIMGAVGYGLGGELTRRLEGWQVISWAVVLSAPIMLVALLVMAPAWPTAPSALAVGGLLYVGLFSQFIGFFAWNRGLALGGIARVGQLQLLQTFVTLAAAAGLLGEVVGVREIVFAAIVAGIVALGWRARIAR